MPRKEDPDASSDSEESKTTKKKRVWKYKKRFKLVKNEETSEDDNSNNNTFDVALDDSRDYSNDGIETTRPAKVAKISKPPIDEFAFASVDTQIKTDPDDCDKMFLLSLLPHLKTIPEEFRLNVKMELMQVLKNANYNTEREHKLI